MASAQKADFRFFTVADGLPQNTVFSVAQDDQGFIWLNAGQHITRFDGAKFLSHVNSSHPIFNQNREGFAEMQTDGDLLVYCLNGRIVSTNTLTGEETAVPVAGHLPAGYDANQGHCLKLGNGEMVAAYPAQAAEKVAVLWLKKGRIDRMVEVSGVAAGLENFYFLFCGDGLGNLYFLSAGLDAILKFGPSGEKLQTMPIEKISTSSIARLLPGQLNSVFLTFDNQIFRLQQGASAFQPHPASRFIQIGQNSIFDLVEMPDGNFWVACSGRHLLFYDAGQQKMLDYHKELASHILDLPAFNKIWLDKSDNLWITTQVGVLRVTPNAALFDTYFTEQHANCPVYCSFRGFAEDGYGSIYTSFYNNIFKINSPKDRQSNYTPLIKKDITGPFDLIFHKGKLVLNTGEVLDLKTGQKEKPYPNTQFTIDWGVFATDTQNNLWWGTRNKVLWLEEQAGLLAWKEIASLPGTADIADVAFDRHNGMIWLCYESSLWTLDPVSKQLKWHGEDQAQMLNKLKCVYPDGKGSTWIGTEKGLVRYDYSTNKWRCFTQSDGLPNDIVVGILPEGDSCLWVSTYNGLSRFSIGNGRFLNFYKADGLADNEFNRASHFTASDGRMYFGGVRGVTAFYPKAVMAAYAKQNRTDRLLLRGITLTEDGSDSTFTQLFPNAGQPLHAYHHNRTIRFDFGLLNSAGNTLYSYMLDGLNNNWSTPTKDNGLTFNSLPSGKYVFRVRAMDARGYWLPQEVAVPLIVHPPWWASWWAYLLYALSLAAAAYGVFHFLKKRWELQNQLQLEQQEALRLKDLDAFKSRLYTNLTHEFRTPLTVILGMAEQGELEIGKLEKLGIGDSQEQLQTISNFLISNFQSIERNGQNLLRLVNQLLDLSKLEDKSFKLKLQHGDIVPFLRYVTESFQSYANGLNLSLRFFTTIEKLEMDFDPEQVQQVMTNLIGNALKFTPSGGDVQVRLTIDDLSRQKSGDEQEPPIVNRKSSIVIQVQDTGIGIPEPAIPHIFDRFYQVDGSTTRAGEGTGIGLAHTLELVKMMGGEISVESSASPLGKRGTGTTFTVALPVVQLPLIPKGKANSSNPAETKLQTITDELPEVDSPLGLRVFAKQMAEQGRSHERNNPTIQQSNNLLLIEDNADVVEYLKTILSEKYHVQVAYNGRIGIERALELVPDLIISDVMMPEMDGYQVLHKLKNDELTSHVPIVLLTAKADAESKVAGLRRGADAYLSKPFDKKELLATLEMMLENRRRMVAYFTGKAHEAVNQPVEELAVENAFLQKVRQIVAENYPDENFALPQLCDLIGMSRSQLFRKMKALMEVSPSDFIRDYRMQQAKTLLETHSLSVKEVAYSVGFKDLSHFSKTFQDAFGVPPSSLSK
ncbi:MAG: ATP-binding protein [Saprospiraceae bacterium]|nr:ATP-binding protein [Saprospiraceae bacterium]